jgi:hypothetical protein
MLWLDSARPQDPLFHIEYNRKDRTGTAWLSKGAPEDSLRGFAIYQSDSATINIDSAHADAFIPYDPVAGFTVHGPPAEGKGLVHFYFVTAVSRNNVESRPVPLLFSNFTN